MNNLKLFSICIEQKKTKKLLDRLDRYDKKRYAVKRKKLRGNSMIGKKVLVLAERIKMKAAPGNFYKQSVQNISYFNEDRKFMIRKKQSIDNIKYYWLTDAQNNKIIKNFKELNYLLLGVILLCKCILLQFNFV